MKPTLNDTVRYLFILQLLLLAISAIIFTVVHGLDGLVAVYSLIPMIGLSPIIAILGIALLLKKQHASWFVYSGFTINFVLSSILFVRFIVISLLLGH
ncbi:MAG: hypothetical protein JWO41_509 [Candidatus Saccharibacteria bacterium]|nr:hypothetical protein [Candidatus Saccharibacteria bacterium]